jgi:hypothetical protein
MIVYRLTTNRATHLCETAGEVDRKAWLAKLLDDWVMVFKDTDDGDSECVFNWPARRLPKGENK